MGGGVAFFWLEPELGKPVKGSVDLLPTCESLRFLAEMYAVLPAEFDHGMMVRLLVVIMCKGIADWLRIESLHP
jgi:hypothetical protein